MNLELLADRERAETVRCPLVDCAAEPGEPCRNVLTGDPLNRLPAHDARLKAAGVVHAPLDPREIAADPDRRPR